MTLVSSVTERSQNTQTITQECGTDQRGEEGWHPHHLFIWVIGRTVGDDAEGGGDPEPSAGFPSPVLPPTERATENGPWTKHTLFLCQAVLCAQIFKK